MTEERGTCRVCNRPFRLKRDGTVWNHGDGKVFPPMNCPGAGKQPREQR